MALVLLIYYSAGHMN